MKAEKVIEKRLDMETRRLKEIEHKGCTAWHRGFTQGKISILEWLLKGGGKHGEGISP